MNIIYKYQRSCSEAAKELDATKLRKPMESQRCTVWNNNTQACWPRHGGHRVHRASPGLLAHLEGLVREADADLALVARLHDERLKVVRLPPPGHRPVALRGQIRRSSNTRPEHACPGICAVVKVVKAGSIVRGRQVTDLYGAHVVVVRPGASVLHRQLVLVHLCHACMRWHLLGSL